MKSSIAEIVKNDLCTGCGLCVSESSSANMLWNEYGFLVPDISNQTFSDKAIHLCPFNPHPKKEIEDEDKLGELFLNESTQWDSRLGRFVKTYIGYSTEFRDTSSSGGIATFIFSELLKQKIVEHLFIVKEVQGVYQYHLFSKEEDIKNISKTRYFPVTLNKLFKIINSIQGRVAVSGVACFIKAIRLKQYQQPDLKIKIPFLVGIICGGVKSRFFTEYLAQRAGIQKEYFNQDYRIKDEESSSLDYSFGAFDDKKQFHQIKMKQIGDMWGTGYFKSNACDFCTDVTTELADISLGDAWLPEYQKDGMGNSVIVTRSTVANSLIENGIKNGGLFVKEVDKSLIIQSQSGSYTHRQDAIYFRVKILRKRHVFPRLRERFFKNIPLLNQLIQKNRRVTRHKSLSIWKDNGNAAIFDREMYKYALPLKLLTKLLHKIRRAKNIIKKVNNNK